MRLIFYFSADDVGPSLLSQWFAEIKLLAHQPCGARMGKKGQEDATGLVIVAGGVEADTVFGAGRKYRVGQVYFAVVEDDNGNVLKRHTGCLFLLDDKGKMLPT